MNPEKFFFFFFNSEFSGKMRKINKFTIKSKNLPKLNYENSKFSGKILKINKFTKKCEN